MGTIIGIDPGLYGAVVVLVDGDIAAIHDAPTHIGANERRALTRRPMADLIRPYADTPGVIAATETSGTRSGRGAGSAYVTGYGYGLWLGILAAFDIPTSIVTPTTWKRAHGIPAGSDKNASRHLAIATWPDHAHHFRRDRDDGRAEAALIALHQHQRTETHELAQ